MLNVYYRGAANSMLKWDNFWEEFKAYDNKMTEVEETVIREAFRHIVGGNSFFEDVSSTEMRSFYDVFEWGWITASMLKRKEKE